MHVMAQITEYILQTEALELHKTCTYLYIEIHIIIYVKFICEIVTVHNLLIFKLMYIYIYYFMN